VKTPILALVGISTAACATMVVVKWQNHLPSSAKTAASSAVTAAPSANDSSVPADVPAPEPVPSDPNVPKAAGNTVTPSITAPSSATAPEPSATKPSITADFSQPLQTLLSPQSNYAQKQAAWKELQDTHQLDQAISDLERAVKVDSSVAEYSAALGEAYVQKLRTLQDFREQSILAIKADQSFDQALKLNPSSWEARYWKALSLSYWPDALNKTGAVIDNLVTLVEQQESQSPHPQFAQTYLLLGEQYLKVGYTDDAREAWRRGVSLFPADNMLREKLAGLQ